jgi:hypothetical protein
MAPPVGAIVFFDDFKLAQDPSPKSVLFDSRVHFSVLLKPLYQ